MAGYATRRAGGAGVAGGNHICRDQQVCVTLRWREKDSNLWYRGTKAVRGIAGVTGRGPRLLVDGTPETHPLAGDPSNHFVQVPSSARAGRPPQSPCGQRPRTSPPSSEAVEPDRAWGAEKSKPRAESRLGRVRYGDHMFCTTPQAGGEPLRDNRRSASTATATILPFGNTTSFEGRSALIASVTIGPLRFRSWLLTLPAEVQTVGDRA
jgi:hypothetical protein